MNSTSHPTVGLSMIVKDESEIIERCLASALPVIDYVLVVDTGSTDGTPEVIAAFLEANDIPGQVAHHPWLGFADARTHALALMRERDGAGAN